MKVKVLGKTWNVIKLHAIAPLLHAPQNLLSLYELDLDQEVIDELTRRGADLNDPESLHRIIVQAAEGERHFPPLKKVVEVMMTGHTLSIMYGNEFVFTTSCTEDGCREKILDYLREHNMTVTPQNRENFPWLKEVQS